MRAVKPTAVWVPIIIVMALTALAGRSDAQTGIVSFSQSSYSVTVGQASAPITVLSTGGGDTGAVMFATFDGTAMAGVNYGSATGTLFFAAGVLSNTFNISILGSGIPQSTQTVNLVLSNPSGFAVLGSPSVATLLIINPSTQAVQFAQSAFTVNEGESNAFISVTRAGLTNGAIAVDFSTSDGSAKAGVDYTTTTGTVTIAAGVLSNMVTIPILESGPLQTNQTINLTLTNAVGADLGIPKQAVLTILAIGPTAMGFSAANYKAHEKDGTVTLDVIRFGDSTSNATVNFATSDGTAKNGIDYVSTTGTVSFASGVSSAAFNVQFLNPKGIQGNKTINVTLSNPVGGMLATQSTAVVTIISDQKQVITFKNSGGELVTVTLQHGGTMNISNQPGPVDIVLSETGTNSTLTIKVKKSKTGTGLVKVDTITGDADCGSITAPTADLVGSGFQLPGYIAKLQIHDVLNGAAVIAGGTNTQHTAFRAHNIDNGAAISFGSDIKTMQAARFGVASIVAPSMGTLSIKGDKKGGIRGDFEGVLTLSSSNAPAGKSTLSKINVSGSISNASISVTNGSIGSIAASTMIDSHVYVGYTPTATNAPLAGGTFVPTLRLGSLQIKSKVNGLDNSFVVAAQVGKVNLASVETDNVGVPFGILAKESISSVKIKAPAFKWNPLGPTDQFSGDFQVILP